MSSISPPLLNLSWSLWKVHWKDVLATAAVAAALEAGAFCLFLYMFVQDADRLLPVVAGSLIVFWLFHVGVSALHAYLISHPALSKAVAPPSGPPSLNVANRIQLQPDGNASTLKEWR